MRNLAIYRTTLSAVDCNTGCYLLLREITRKLGFLVFATAQRAAADRSVGCGPAAFCSQLRSASRLATVHLASADTMEQTQRAEARRMTDQGSENSLPPVVGSIREGDLLRSLMDSVPDRI